MTWEMREEEEVRKDGSRKEKVWTSMRERPDPYTRNTECLRMNET